MLWQIVSSRMSCSIALSRVLKTSLVLFLRKKKSVKQDVLQQDLTKTGFINICTYLPHADLVLNGVNE